MKFKIDNTGAYLKQIRIENNIKLKEVSELTGFSSGYISRIENGSSNLTKQALEKLCKVYSLDINEIIEYDDLELAESESKNDITKYISNNEVYFDDKKLSINDKIAIIDFVRFLTTVEDYTIKESCVNIIKSATKLSTTKGE